MPWMPYHLEKGPMLAVIEDYVNADADRAVAVLRTLRIARGDTGFAELWELPWFRSTNLSGKPGNPYWQDFRDKWLGMNPAAPGKTMWIAWEGDAEGIARRTLRSALEVSLGVDADQPVPDTPRRHWPIEFFWKCAQNWLEGWITYRRHGATGSGSVRVVFATPSDGSIIIDRPADHRLVRRSPGFEENPTSTQTKGIDNEAGMWVVTHRHNHAEPTAAVQVTPLSSTFTVVLNPARFVGRDGLVTVSPSEVDGGVLPEPRPFVP